MLNRARIGCCLKTGYGFYRFVLRDYKKRRFRLFLWNMGKGQFLPLFLCGRKIIRVWMSKAESISSSFLYCYRKLLLLYVKWKFFKCIFNVNEVIRLLNEKQGRENRRIFVDIPAGEKWAQRQNLKGKWLLIWLFARGLFIPYKIWYILS